MNDAAAPFSLPLLVIAGFPRTGTTTLYRNFEHHPGFAAPLRKELNAFLKDDPPHDYRQAFDQWEPGKICLDISPLYSLDPLSAGRIHRFAPLARVVLLVREPADWIYSVYAHARSFSIKPLEFSEFLESPWLPIDGRPMRFSLAGGCYAPVIESYARTFGNQLLVIDFAALVQDPVAVLQQIESFAGAAPYFSESTVNRQRNNASKPTPGMLRLFRRLATSDLIIRSAIRLVPASWLRHIRAWLYYSDGKTRASSARPNVSSSPQVGETLAADVAYYRTLFGATPFRCGDELKGGQPATFSTTPQRST